MVNTFNICGHVFTKGEGGLYYPDESFFMGTRDISREFDNKIVIGIGVDCGLKIKAVYDKDSTDKSEWEYLFVYRNKNNYSSVSTLNKKYEMWLTRL